MKLTLLLRLVGGLQVVLGALYLTVPDTLLLAMGHSQPATDLHYPLAMLASRFLAYGTVLMWISSAPDRHRLWLVTMVAIQAIDLAAGVGYTLAGVVPLSLSAVPMFNASWIILLLLLWMPKREVEAAAH